MRRYQHGFTTIELLVVLAILYADTAAHTAGLAGLHGNGALVRRTAGYLYRIGIRP